MHFGVAPNHIRSWYGDVDWQKYKSPNKKYRVREQEEFKRLVKYYREQSNKKHDARQAKRSKYAPVEKVDQVDKMQWPFNIAYKNLGDYDFESYDMEIPQSEIAKKYNTEAKIQTYMARVYRDEFLIRLKTQLKQQTNENALSIARHRKKACYNIIKGRLNSQGVPPHKHDKIIFGLAHQFRQECVPVTEYKDRPYILVATHKLQHEVDLMRAKRLKELNMVFGPPENEECEDDGIVTRPAA